MSNKVLIPFSSGVESTAAVIHAIEKFGNKNIITFSMNYSWHDKRFLKQYRGFTAQRHHAKQICSMYNIEHYEIDRNFSSNAKYAMFQQFPIFTWVHDALMILLSSRDITEFYLCCNKEESSVFEKNNHPHVYLLNHLNECLKNYSLDVNCTMPLNHLTKKQQWDMIPQQVQSWVYSCNTWVGIQFNDLGRPHKYRPCGVCYKCKELSSVLN